MVDAWSLSDAVVTLRPPRRSDAEVLIAGRDGQSARWLGSEMDNPQPAACIVVKDTIVGWVDFDNDRSWLTPGQVNIGYNVFPAYRRRGYAWRALLLLLQRLAEAGVCHTATLSINSANTASLRVAAKAGFTLVRELPNGLLFERPIPAS